VIFFTIKAVQHHNEHTGLIQLFKEAVKEHGVKVRIMIPAGNKIINDIINALKEEQLNIQYLKKSLQTDVTVFVVDNVFSLTVESKKDDRKEEKENIMATYSTVESTVISYASIFETLWTEGF
jgi:two-component system, OmpR family, sensor histidine kinase VicK